MSICLATWGGLFATAWRRIPNAVSRPRSICATSSEELQREMLSSELRSGEVPLEEFQTTRTDLPTLNPKRRDYERFIAGAATLIVVLVIAALAWLRLGGSTEVPTGPDMPPPGEAVAKTRQRIVVLPLENLGPAEHAYFAAGVTEEIASRLASVSALNVISRTTARQYDRADKTLQEIGADLGIDYLLDGTVRWNINQTGDSRVRVTPQLIRVSDDSQVWSQTYDRVIDDIFAVQSEIASEVIHQLDIVLLEPELEALASRPTRNLTAYQAYLRGMDYASRREPDPETWQLAVQMFQRAVGLDPRFALAYAELSEAHSLMYHWIIDRTPERRELARIAAERALEIDPDLPEGHRARAYYYYRGHRDYEAALREFDIAARALPNDSQLLEGIAYIRRRQGLFEDAASQLERALEIQPKSDWIAAELAQTYTTMRRYESADRFYHLAISLTPDQPAPYQSRVRNYLLWRGDTTASRRTLESMPRQDTTSSVLAWFNLELIERNYHDALLRLQRNTKAKLIGVESASYPRSLLQALVYRRLDQQEIAQDLFENARLMLEGRLPEGRIDPRLRITLAMAYAGLGRKEDALREGLLAVEQYPIETDAFIGPRFVEHLAAVYVMVGEPDAALDRIEYLLSIPSDLSIASLRIDPRWDALREHPRFRAMLEGSHGDA